MNDDCWLSLASLKFMCLVCSRPSAAVFSRRISIGAATLGLYSRRPSQELTLSLAKVSPAACLWLSWDGLGATFQADPIVCART